MKVTESVRISWRAITGHKLRSSLTTLGIVIGVGSVIVFMVLGGGFEQNIINDIDDEDDPGMRVSTQQSAGFGVQFIDSPIYTESDVEALESIDGVDFVAPEANLPAVQLIHDGERRTGGFLTQALSEDRLDSGDIVAGEPFSGGDEIVLTESATEIVEGGLAVGDELSLTYEDGTTDTFTVSGITDQEPVGSRLPGVYVSLDAHYETTIETPDGDTERAYSSLIIAAESPGAVEDVKKEAVTYFEEESDAGQLKGEEQEIAVQTVDDAIEQVTDIVDQLTVFIGGIAAISLVVGSIGIANIMIVSVTERIREIGVMKAVGARKRDVIQLFLVESVILGAIGALLGVLVGLGFGYLGVTLIGWPMVVPTDWILIAVVIGVTVGVLSGLYPAWSGAKVDPIEALRHE
jgi:putative ABC transport system permease protein